MEKKIKLQTTDDLKRVVEFEAEHAKRILATPGVDWIAAPKGAATTEVYAYPGETVEVSTVEASADTDTQAA